jgi:hypothetical protein
MKTILSELERYEIKLEVLLRRAENIGQQITYMYNDGNMVTALSMAGNVSSDHFTEIAPGVMSKKMQDNTCGLSFIVKFAPFAMLGAHKHDLPEEITTIEGELSDGPDMIPEKATIPAYQVHTISAGINGALCVVSFPANSRQRL